MLGTIFILFVVAAIWVVIISVIVGIGQGAKEGIEKSRQRYASATEQKEKPDK